MSDAHLWSYQSNFLVLSATGFEGEGSSDHVDHILGSEPFASSSINIHEFLLNVL